MTPTPSHRTLTCPKYDKLVPKKTAKSPVWTFYSVPALDSGEIVCHDIVICCLCKHPVSSKGGSTTNMIAHLKSYHPVEYGSINLRGMKRPLFSEASCCSQSVDDPTPILEENLSVNNNQPSLSQPPPPKKQKTLLEFQPLSTNSEKQCTASVVKFIAKAMQPFSIVESPPFIDMLKTLNPRYKLPGRKYFTKTAIPKLFNETKEKIKKELDILSPGNISITTDCWTSINNIPYIAITVHFVDENWKLKSACLGCIHFNSDHTHENISEVLKNKLQEWNLNINDLFTCTTDGGANILKAISLFNVQQVPCFGHAINNGIDRALKDVTLQRVISKVKKLQSSISHSWKMSRDFNKAQEHLLMKVEKLPSACPTRWWSTLKLCKRFLDNQLPLCKLFKDFYPTKRHLMLEASYEVSSLEEFISTTALMEDITKTLSGQEYTTASSVLPLLLKIKKNLREKERDNDRIKKLKQQIMSALMERYFDNPELMNYLRFATVCDPRFRLTYNYEKEITRNLLLLKMQNIYEEIHTESATNRDIEKAPKTGLDKLLACDDDEEEMMECSVPAQKAENELKNYLAMPKINLNEDPLNWWKLHEISFPSLKVLAKKHLAIQGTSVPSERVFSTGGNIVNKNRSSLLPKHAEMLVFLSQNKSFI